MNPMSKRLLLCLALAGVIGAGSASAQTSAPPAVYQPPQVDKAANATMLLLPATAPAREIVLSVPAATEKAALLPKSAAASSKHGVANKRRAIGFARVLPATESAFPLPPSHGVRSPAAAKPLKCR